MVLVASAVSDVDFFDIWVLEVMDDEIVKARTWTVDGESERRRRRKAPRWWWRRFMVVVVVDGALDS